MMRAVRGGRGPLVQFRSAGSAVNDIPAGATAFAHRTGQVFVVGTLSRQAPEAT